MRHSVQLSVRSLSLVTSMLSTAGCSSQQEGHASAQPLQPVTTGATTSMPTTTTASTPPLPSSPPTVPETTSEVSMTENAGGSGGLSPSSGGTGGTAAGGTGGQAEPEVMDIFESVDFKGECWGGVPPEDGETSVVEVGKAYDVVAIGTEMGHHCAEDQGRFIYMELEGDFDISVRLTQMDNFGETDIQGRETPAKGGLMARVSLEVDSPSVAMWAAMPDEDYPDAWHFDHRSQPGGSIKDGDYAYGYINRNSDLWDRQLPDIYIRLKRTGNRFEAWGSHDGESWVTPDGHSGYETNFPDKLFVGLSAMSSPEGSFEGRSEISFRELEGFPPETE